MDSFRAWPRSSGSDPSGGAGLQSDLKVVQALGAYGTSAVTALTVQDTVRVHEVYPIDPFLVERQLETVLEDVGADCIKIGMLARRATVELVAYRSCSIRCSCRAAGTSCSKSTGTTH